MFIALLLALVAAGFSHAVITKQKTRTAEFILLYVLIGYCALPLGFIGLRALLMPEIMIQNMKLTAEPSFVRFTASLIVALAIMAVLALRLRGAFLIAPVIGWAVFWLGADYAHIGLLHDHGQSASAAYTAQIFAAHGMVSLVLLAALAGYWRQRS